MDEAGAVTADSPPPSWYDPPESICECEAEAHDGESWHEHCEKCEPGENPWERDDDD